MKIAILLLAVILLSCARQEGRGPAASARASVTRLVDLQRIDYIADWSPDGRRVLFSRSYHESDIWVADVGELLR